MKKFFGFIKLTRPANCFITMLVVLVGGIISSNRNSVEYILFFSSIIAALVAASGNVINDYFDVEIDKISHPERPLANGTLNKESALTFYIILLSVNLILSGLLHLKIFIVVLLTEIILFLYSFYVKKIPLIGNVVISFLTGLAFLFGGIAVNNVSAALIPATFAFLINFIREVVKDTEDMEGDIKNSVVTFPVKFGIRKTQQLVLFATILLILFTIYPFLTEIYKVEYFVIVMMIVNPLLIYSLKIFFSIRNKADIHKISILLKVNMIFGLLAIFLGK